MDERHAGVALINAINKRRAGVPVLVVSAMPAAIYRSIMKALDAWDYLQKTTFEEADFIETFLEILRVARERRAEQEAPAPAAAELALDPAARYQSARELGHDLNVVLFSLPRPVSSFDLANLVTPVAQARDAEKAQRMASGSLIGSLIDQALFQFTSLNSGGESVVGRLSGPIDVHSFSGSLPMARHDEPLDWGNSLGFSTAPLAHDELDQFQVGNLSALEDTRSASQPAIPTGQASRVHVPAHAPVPDFRGRSRRAPRMNKTLSLILTVVFLFTVGGLAGAYFAGVLPKPVQKSLGLPRR